MVGKNADKNIRPEYDKVLQDIVKYTQHYVIASEEALNTAFYCLMDTLGCGLRALNFSECTRHLGPVVEGAEVADGARVPGTQYRLDPVKAAWDIGCIIRWLDFNDTWLAAEWGHPSDNLGAILATADYISQKNRREGMRPVSMRQILEAMVKAHEIQGCLALENSFNRVGLDHVLLVKAASTAVVAQLHEATTEQMLSALSHAFVDGQALRTYRHAPNAGSRKSWAAGDATSRAVRLVDMALRGEMGIPGVLTAPGWGFYDVSFGGKPFEFQRDYGEYVMENVLFKVAFPAEFHAQTAVEAAMKLHLEVKDRIDEIERIEITTHESAIRIISKTGDLANPADRDHCLQYMVSIPLLFGDLNESHYSDAFHEAHVKIDRLRAKMVVSEDADYTKDYHRPDKRSISNAVQIFFADGQCTEKVAVEYPLGHRQRRAEAVPLLKEKFIRSVDARYRGEQAEKIKALFDNRETLEKMAVDEFMDFFVSS